MYDHIPAILITSRAVFDSFPFLSIVWLPHIFFPEPLASIFSYSAPHTPSTYYIPWCACQWIPVNDCTNNLLFIYLSCYSTGNGGDSRQRWKGLWKGGPQVFFLCFLIVCFTSYFMFRMAVLSYSPQCLKLRVRPAPEAHISDEGRTVFGTVHPMCAHFPQRKKPL